MNPHLPAIDAHAHVFRRDLKFADARRYTPDYDASLEGYLDHLDRNGLTHGVLVQPSFLGTDNSYLLESLTRASGRLKGIAVVADDAAQDELRALDRAGVVGIRLNLVGQALPDLSSVPWRAMLRSVKAMGWHVEVQRNASDLARIVPHLLDAGVVVVVDHYGLPDPGAGVDDPGFHQLLGFAASRQVWVKISAPYRNGETLARRLYPHLRDAFGLDRLMWGSDWPHTQFERTQTYERNRAFRDAVLGDEAQTVLASPRDLYRF